jgi:hypothetical protein
MPHESVDYLNLFPVLSNLFLLIPFVTAVLLQIKKIPNVHTLVFAAFILFTECFVSLTYHVCLFSNYCLFPFTTLGYLDFFFAQLFIVYLAIYIIHFPHGYAWLEWTFVFTGCFLIVIMQIILPGELSVQAGIVICAIAIVFIYWIVYAGTWGNGKIPPYDWYNFTLGFVCLAISTMMFSFQNIYPSLYWAEHSIWHFLAAMGFHFILLIKDVNVEDNKKK